MAGHVQVAAAGPVRTLTLARPAVHNAFDDALIAELHAAVDAASTSTDVRVIILAAQGPSFCAGADLAWMQRMVDYSMAENLADAQKLADLFGAIRSAAKPVLARVHGPAYGGGVGLVAACDIAVAVASATFCLSEVKLGLVPSVIAPFLAEKTGVGPLRRYALTAERFDAAEARRIGLVHEVAPTEAALDDCVAVLCRTLCANGPQALSACKTLLRTVAQSTWDDLNQYTTRLIAELRVAPEGQEGLRAFLGKRAPAWRRE